MLNYNIGTSEEDRATLGSDPSASVVAYSMGRYLMVPPLYQICIMLLPSMR